MTDNEQKRKIKIQTRLSMARLVLSIWEKVVNNENAELWAWKTVLFSYGEIAKEYESLIKAEDVIDLHIKISEEIDNEHI